MITALNQQDPRWSDVRIGHSYQTVSAKGCTITDICMVMEKLRGYPASPGDAARYWSFTPDAKIDWNNTHFEGIKYIGRGYDDDWGKITEYANDPAKAAIIEVNNGRHWVYAESMDANGIIQIIDPWDGQRYNGLPDKYKFTGYALFEKDETMPPDYAVSDWQDAKTKSPYLASIDPGKIMNSDDIQKVFVDLEKLKNVAPFQAYRLAVLLKRLGLT